MAARRKAEPSWVDELFDLLVVAPVWTGAVAAGVIFAVFRWGAPALLKAAAGGDEFGDTVAGTLAMLSSRAAPLAAGVVVAIWLAALVAKAVRSKPRPSANTPPPAARSEPSATTVAATKQPRAAPAPPQAVTCPTCNAPMVRRTARSGPHAGKAFMGCSRYPACRRIRQVD